MVREERELQRAFSTKEKYEKILINLDDLKAQESTPDDLFNSMKIEYQQSIGQAIATIDRVKRKLEGDIQSEEVNMQRLNQELQNLNTRFKVGEITADDLQKAEQRVRGRMQRSQTLINELKRLQASQSSADVGGYIDAKSGTGGGSSISLSGVPVPQMDNVLSNIRETSITDFSEFSTDVSEITKSPFNLIGPIGGVLLLISIFLPWFTINILNISPFSQGITLMSVSAISNTIGLVVLIELIAALVGIASIFLVWDRARGTVLTAAGAIALVIAVILVPMFIDSALTSADASMSKLLGDSYLGGSSLDSYLGGSGLFGGGGISLSDFYNIGYGYGYYANILAAILMLVGGIMVLGRE